MTMTEKVMREAVEQKVGKIKKLNDYLKRGIEDVYILMQGQKLKEAYLKLEQIRREIVRIERESANGDSGANGEKKKSIGSSQTGLKF